MISASGEALSSETSISTLEQYQAWASTDWLYEPDSDEAQLHARAKFEEEATELTEAMLSGNEEDVVSELGDVLWTATANGQNCGITLEDSIRHELSPDYFDEDSISLGRIDELALELIPEETAEDMASWVKYMAHYVGKAAKQWRNLSPEIDPDKQPETFADAWILLKRARARDGLTQTVLLCSAIAQRFAGKTLQDVVDCNVEKLSARKAAGQPMTKLPHVN